MYKSHFLAGAAALCVLLYPANADAQAFGTISVSDGTYGEKPLRQDPVDPEASPEDIMAAAGKDMNAKKYYNRPGATLKEYYGDWQTCRLIARGSFSAVRPFFYNPVGVSPLAAGVGGAIGSAIGAALAEGAMRDGNRLNCMLIKGWRVVRPDVPLGARITQSKGDRLTALLEALVGEEEPDGKIVDEWEDNVLPGKDPVLNLEAPLSGASTLWLGDDVDPAKPVELEEGEAAVVLAFRRADKASMKQYGFLGLRRYDMATRDLEAPEEVEISEEDREAGNFDQTTYSIGFLSEDKHAAHEIQIVKVTPGFYVIDGAGATKGSTGEHFCFGAPVIEVPAGKVTYIGDWVPFKKVKLSNGQTVRRVLALTNKIEETSEALAEFQPALASGMRPMAVANNATYSCAGQRMWKWGLSGVADLPAPPAGAEPEAGDNAI